MADKKSSLENFKKNGYVIIGWILLIPLVLGTLLFIAIIAQAYLHEGPIPTQPTAQEQQQTTQPQENPQDP